MASAELRPLSLGEMLDRTFSLYRTHFLLFLGINALPHLLILFFQLGQMWIAPAVSAQPRLPGQAPGVVSPGLGALGLLGALVGIVVYLAAYLFAQGGTVCAVSELYLGRSATVMESLKRMRGHALLLFGVSFLVGIASGFAAILLIIPGVYVACRLMTAVPASLLEDLGARDSLSRSWDLTTDYAGRGFVIYLLYFVLLIVAATALTFPFTFALGYSTVRDPSLIRMWASLSQIGNFVADVLVQPFFTLAAAVFYFDLRVRKEGFDLQMMMHPDAGVAPAGSGAALPSMFS